MLQWNAIWDQEKFEAWDACADSFQWDYGYLSLVQSRMQIDPDLIWAKIQACWDVMDAAPAADVSTASQPATNEPLPAQADDTFPGSSGALPAEHGTIMAPADHVPSVPTPLNQPSLISDEVSVGIGSSAAEQQPVRDLLTASDMSRSTSATSSEMQLTEQTNLAAAVAYAATSHVVEELATLQQMYPPAGHQAHATPDQQQQQQEPQQQWSHQLLDLGQHDLPGPLEHQQQHSELSNPGQHDFQGLMEQQSHHQLMDSGQHDFLGLPEQQHHHHLLGAGQLAFQEAVDQHQHAASSSQDGSADALSSLSLAPLEVVHQDALHPGFSGGQQQSSGVISQQSQDETGSSAALMLMHSAAGNDHHSHRHSLQEST